MSYRAHPYKIDPNTMDEDRMNFDLFLLYLFIYLFIYFFYILPLTQCVKFFAFFLVASLLTVLDMFMFALPLILPRQEIRHSTSW